MSLSPSQGAMHRVLEFSVLSNNSAEATLLSISVSNLSESLGDLFAKIIDRSVVKIDRSVVILYQDDNFRYERN